MWGSCAHTPLFAVAELKRREDDLKRQEDDLKREECELKREEDQLLALYDKPRTNRKVIQLMEKRIERMAASIHLQQTHIAQIMADITQRQTKIPPMEQQQQQQQQQQYPQAIPLGNTLVKTLHPYKCCDGEISSVLILFSCRQQQGQPQDSAAKRRRVGNEYTTCSLLHPTLLCIHIWD